MLNVQNLSVTISGHSILKDVSFSVSEGQWLMVVGPNGAGKSTTVSAITQGIAYDGSITYEGADVARMKSGARARAIGVLAQNHYVSYAFTVEELVRMGRYSHAAGLFRREAAPDEGEAAVEEALEITGLKDLRDHSVLTLSGGELQRTFLAQVLAQQPRLLLLDEPTNHLDLIYQKQVFALIADWLKTPGRAVLSVVHDLSLARAYGTHALLLHKGKTIACGEVKDVLSSRQLDPVYGMDVRAWMKTMLGQWE